MGKHKKNKVKKADVDAASSSGDDVSSNPRVVVVVQWLTPVKVVVWDDLASPTYAVVERFANLQSFKIKNFSGYGVPLENLLPKLDRMKAIAQREPDTAPHLLPLVRLIMDEMKVVLDAMHVNREAGLVKFDALWGILPEGAEVVFDNAGVHQGGTIVSATYQSGWSPGFVLTVSCLSFSKGSLQETTRRVTVPLFEETVKISTLSARPLDEDTKRMLDARGAGLLRMLEGGATYLAYEGEMLFRSWFGDRRTRAVGRVMVDPVTFRKLNANYHDGYRDVDDTEAASTGRLAGSLEEYWRITPWTLGFSFTTKLWGELNVEKLVPIQFDARAYEQLVLPDRQIGGTTIRVKSLVRSLVEHGDLAFTDFISHKGGGMIFLLHGPPGGGKTLTAEAIADLLRRPLYAISVGELGTTPTDLEEHLRVVLEVAVLWNAVVLIDEADIFLERRTPNDVVRNALVSIFLRLLEYHQGVLFLTTNRVANLDEAFHSRVSLALYYPEHRAEEREQIWANLLDASGIDASRLDLEELAQVPLNGRQIKNAVRIASAIAHAEKRAVLQTDIEQILALSHQFVQDLKATDPLNVRRLVLNVDSHSQAEPLPPRELKEGT